MRNNTLWREPHSGPPAEPVDGRFAPDVEGIKRGPKTPIHKDLHDIRKMVLTDIEGWILELLNVDVEAPEKEIKTAARRLRIEHQDLNSSATSSEIKV